MYNKYVYVCVCVRACV